MACGEEEFANDKYFNLCNHQRPHYRLFFWKFLIFLLYKTWNFFLERLNVVVSGIIPSVMFTWDPMTGFINMIQNGFSLSSSGKNQLYKYMFDYKFTRINTRLVHLIFYQLCLNFCTPSRVESIFCGSGWVGSDIYGLGLDLEIFPKNVKFFNFLLFGSKKISSGWVGKYPGQR